MTRANYILEAHQEDIYDDIKEGLFETAKKNLIRFQGALDFAWKTEVITYKEWSEYNEWENIAYKEILKVQKELKNKN